MDAVPKNVHWLMPEEPTPCDIFLYFRGQYASAISAGQPVSFKILEKFMKVQCSQIFIRREDLSSWDAWVNNRCPSPHNSGASSISKDQEKKSKNPYGNKRLELMSYLQKCTTLKVENDPALSEAFQKGHKLIQQIVNAPILDWYFQKFHDPPELFHHCGRIALHLAIFLQLRKIATDEEVQAICFSSLIQELEGSLEENQKKVVSEETISYLEKNQHPIPREVIEYISNHDELCSGKGFPKNRQRNEIPPVVRTFSLFNHFDTYRTRNAGTRRSRFDRAKEAMVARQADYDPALWPLFWAFWERQIEVIS